MKIDEKYFIEIIQKYDDLNVNRAGLNLFDKLVVQSENSELNISLRKIVLHIIETKLFDLDKRIIFGLILFLYQTKIMDNEIVISLNKKSEINIIQFPESVAIVLRFVGSIDNSLLNRELILNSKIKEINFWLWTDLLFRLNDLSLLGNELNQHFNSGARDYNFFLQRLNYWKTNSSSFIIDSIIDDVYSFLSVKDKKIMTDLIDFTLKIETNINRFEGVDFISDNYKPYISKIF